MMKSLPLKCPVTLVSIVKGRVLGILIPQHRLPNYPNCSMAHAMLSWPALE